MNKQYGLSLKEQACFLWALCRYSNNPESCPQILMKDLPECPFSTNIKCEELPVWAWLPILEKRIIPEEN